MSELPPVSPFDEHNRKLVGNVHPPDWTNPEPSGRYNLVVLGAGSAGLITAAVVHGTVSQNDIIVYWGTTRQDYHSH